MWVRVPPAVLEYMMSNWNEKNKTKKRTNDRGRHYRDNFSSMMIEFCGLDGMEGYDLLRERQNYCCYICGRSEEQILKDREEKRKKKKLPPPKKTQPALLHEHCHKKNKMRCLCCHDCNNMIAGYERLAEAFGSEERMREYFDG